MTADSTPRAIRKFVGTDYSYTRGDRFYSGGRQYVSGIIDTYRAVLQSQPVEAISCNKCGGNVPVGYGRENFVCPYCGAKDSVDPEAMDRLRRFYQALKDLENAAKQIPPGMRKLIEKTYRYGRMMILSMLMLAGSFMLIAGFVLHDFIKRWLDPEITIRWEFLPGEFIPIWIVIGFLIWTGWLVWRRRKLNVAFKARPPLEPGGPSRCRLCGAPLPDTGVIRRCAYCGTDSVVSEKTFQPYHDDLLAEIRRVEEGLAEKLKRQIRKIGTTYAITPMVFMGIIGGVIVGAVAYFLVLDMFRYGADWLEYFIPGFIGLAIVFSVFFVFIIPAQYRAMKRDRDQYLS